ncbi:MAG: HEAT repeat domain-containing protein, partial [Candidatus Woesearchaeota archaeon]|nr:HEAT repeat domain-containing protein [Candidatus Woesearchaeota archaeon]
EKVEMLANNDATSVARVRSVRAEFVTSVVQQAVNIREAQEKQILMNSEEEKPFSFQSSFVNLVRSELQQGIPSLFSTPTISLFSKIKNLFSQTIGLRSNEYSDYETTDSETENEASKKVFTKNSNGIISSEFVNAIITGNVITALVVGEGSFESTSKQVVDVTTEYKILLATPEQNTERRVAVVSSLASHGASAVQSLKQALSDPSTEVKQAAIEGLGLIGHATALEALQSINPSLSQGAGENDKNAALRRQLAQSFARFGEQALPDLVRLLNDKDTGVQSVVIPALGVIGGAEALVALRTKLSKLKNAPKEELEKTVGLRRRMAEALGKIGTPASDAIISLLDDPDESVQSIAAKVFAKLSKEDPVSAVNTLMNKYNALLKDGSSKVKARIGIVQALGSLGEISFDELSKTLRDPDATVQATAATALAIVGRDTPERTVSVLSVTYDDLLKGDARARAVVVESLAKLGDVSFSVLVKALGDADLGVKSVAVKSIGLIGQSKPQVAIFALQSQYVNADAKLKVLLIEAAGQLGEFGVGLLRGALNDKDVAVKTAAAKALGVAGSSDAQATLALLSAQYVALKTGDAGARRAVVESLGKLGVVAMPVLHSAIADADFGVKQAAITGFARAGIEDRLGTISILSGMYYQLLNKDNEAETRVVLIKALGGLGSDSLSVLSFAFSDTNNKVRSAAAVGFVSASRDDPLTASQTLQTRYDAEKNVAARVVIVQVLGKLGEAGLQGLGVALSDADQKVQEAALEGIASFGGLDALNVLRENSATLNKGKSELRQKLVQVLARFGELAEKDIELFTIDDDPLVKAVALNALGEVKKADVEKVGYTSDAVSKLVAQYKELMYPEPKNPVLRLSTVQSLGSMGALALPTLKEALLDSKKADPDKGVLNAAIVSIGRIGGAEAVRILLEKYNSLKGTSASEPGRRSFAAETEKSAPQTQDLTRGYRDTGLRLAIVDTLAPLGFLAFSALETAFEDIDDGVKKSAIQGIGSIGGES